MLEGSRDGKIISDHIKDVYCTQDYDHDCREGGGGRLVAKRGEAESSSVVRRAGGGRLVSSKPSTTSTSSSYYGVETHSPEQLEEVMGSLSNTWGLDVFTASTLIRDSRVLTCTTFRYSSPLSSLLLLVLKPFFQNPAGERSPSHLPDPSSYLALLPDDLGGPLPEGCPVPQPPPCSRRHPVLPLPSQLGCPSRGDFQERVSE